MNSHLVNALKLRMQPVAVILTNEKPSHGVQFKEGSRNGCVGSMMIAASKGRTAIFDRKTYGCPGGGVGLGFGDRYGGYPIDCLLSTGNKEYASLLGRPGSEMEHGERFFKNKDTARKWVNSLPLTNIPTEYVVLKPFQEISEGDQPKLVIFFVNADQLSALIVLSGYCRGVGPNVQVPFGAACQSIIFGYAEAEKEIPCAVLGFFDIAQRKLVDREILTFTVPYQMYREMEANVDGSFLDMHVWRKIQERQ